MRYRRAATIILPAATAEMAILIVAVFSSRLSRYIVVHAETRDGSFELWVANAGQPIPPSSIEKLFEPFFRGKARASRQGLGLGLYIASQIARAHGGILTVALGLAETRFTFSMPLG